MEQENKLITFQDLALDPEQAFKADQLNQLLNKPPREEWLKPYPAFMKVKGKYLPVDKHEWLMTMIFQEWRREILDSKLIANSIMVTVRVHYRNPITGQWSWHDGIGAQSLQVDADAAPNNANAMKPHAVTIAAPNAASRAFKDACECLGKLFGKDLNKKDTFDFIGIYGQQEEQQHEKPITTPPPVNTTITTNF